MRSTLTSQGASRRDYVRGLELDGGWDAVEIDGREKEEDIIALPRA